ncbi:MAG: ferredoxin [Candidatus Absconditabacterales bacterium]
MIKVSDTGSNACIGCGVCGMAAPTLFKVEGVPATVIKQQPETPEEQIAYEQAEASCPVGAISNEDAMKKAA